MIIYPTETDDGLAGALSNASSISYACLVEKTDNQLIISDKKNIKAIAGITDTDLYYTQSILVTTSWNKNDDIFDKNEVWAARATPIHKPTNLEHNEAIIVGHITSNYPMTEDGVLIDENTNLDNLPEKFHILTGSVIYTGYTNPDLRERAAQLIAEIENGTKYVSMECFFKGFDYGLINKSTGEYKILNRNEETAFLTKHLRAYGGLGEHENYKIGRVLRNITFTGKGFVDKPANPESIIFTKDSLNFDKKIANIEINKEKNTNFENLGVFSNQANLKETTMSLEQDIVDLKSKVQSMNMCEEQLREANSTIASLNEKLAASEAEAAVKDKTTKEYMDKVNTTEEDKKKMKAELDETLSLTVAEFNSKIAEYDVKVSDLTAQLEAIQAELNTTNEALAGYKAKEAEMMKREKKMKRMASLLEAGLDTDVATSTVDKFEDLDDSLFESMTAVFAMMMPMKKKKMEEEAMLTMKRKASDEVVESTETETETDNVNETKAEDISEVLENAEPENNIDLSVGSEQDAEINTTRAALVDFVRTRLGKKLNKGE